MTEHDKHLNLAAARILQPVTHLIFLLLLRITGCRTSRSQLTRWPLEFIPDRKGAPFVLWEEQESFVSQHLVNSNFTNLATARIVTGLVQYHYGTSWHTVTVGMAFTPGTSIWTDRNSKVKLFLGENGPSVTLIEHSELFGNLCPVAN
jgi:hypothetical protein